MTIQDQIAVHRAEIIRTQTELEKLVIGRTATIVSDYNGQPFGTSKRSLKGQSFEVREVYITGNGQVTIFLCGLDLGLDVTELEFN